MPSKDPATRVRVAQLAARSRWGADPDQIQRARRELEVERLEGYIKALVSSAPPLTSEQRDRLASLLRGAAA